MLITAHGALGAFDELIFLGTGLIFLGMMGLSWYRSRNEIAVAEESQPENTPAQDAEDQSPEHFRLE